MAWVRLTAVLPWLTLLPHRVVEQLDVDEFAVPDEITAAVVDEAQAAVPTAYLMTYRASRANSPGPRTQLCQVLRPADLTPWQLGVVRDAERRLIRQRLWLCAYARPLSLRRQPDEPYPPAVTGPQEASSS